MASPRSKTFSNAQYYELDPFVDQTSNNREESTYADHRKSQTFVSDHHEPVRVDGLATTILNTHRAQTHSLGKPTVKRRFHALHISAVGLSLDCLTLAIASVGSENLSWRLGVRNYQLIVLGFLLGIMNLCLASVAPSLFLLLEARFGSSTLHNYEGLLRNQILSAKLSLVWRIVLSVMLALPLALSVSYKTFTGGESSMKVDVKTYTHNSSNYGIYGPPGLQSLASYSQGSPEPLQHPHAQPYGFNILSLNNESTALLDVPDPGYVSAVQNLLAGGESWNITAQVIATVATFNHSREKDKNAFKSYFNSFCNAAVQSSGAYTHMSMMNRQAIELVTNISPGNASLQYIAISPDPGLEHDPSCKNVSEYAQPFDINRQACKGVWSITRGGMLLVDGSCNGTILPYEKQQVITNNTLYLGVWYMSPLVEFLGAVATTSSESKWLSSYLATAMAAMTWSRITALNSLASADRPDEWRFSNLSHEDSGISYPVEDDVVYIRPTLRKSGLLYCVLAIQPLLSVIVLGLTAMLRSTPVDKGFGLISILSGIDRGTLDILSGAGLSGKLAKSVKLVIQPQQSHGDGAIRYRCQGPGGPVHETGTLDPNISYR